MSNLTTIVEGGTDDERISRIAAEPDGPRLGAWYWVLKNTDHRGRPTPDWLGCAMKIGSNYVEIHSPHTDRGYSTTRIHFDDFVEQLRYEPDAARVISARIAHWQGETRRLMGDIERVTRTPGMTPQDKLGAPAAQGAAAGGALMVLSSQSNPKDYSTALALAKEETLPALFKEMQAAHGEMARWMKAPVMETLAQMLDQKAVVADIDDRIFSVSLYAGLMEEIVQISDGTPAPMDEKLSVMQKMAYMDEECLANYRTGGMDIQGLGAFDAWLSEAENRDRILPFPRTLVAMRIRRNRKHRDWDGTIRTLRVNLQLEQADKMTFLYVRNGDQLWRLNTEIDFGDLIFPDPSVFNPSEPKMMKMWGSQKVDGFISVALYEQMVAANAAAKVKQDEWKATYTGTNPWFDMPYALRTPHESMSDYKPFDPSSVFYDDGMRKIESEIKLYNRIALIIQGLFDRSMVLHPHPPARTWSAEGFDAAVKLIYDGTGVLHFGEPPDFEAYRSRCNASLREGCTTVGQEDFWERAEGEKESRRLDNDWRSRSEHRPDRFRPYGNPGPGYLARVKKWTRTGKATFEWERKRLKEPGYWEREKGETVKTTITVPATDIFNVDAYRPGDFKQFFADPRTRAQYLQWAPMLIAAEEWHAAKAKREE